MRRFRAGAFSGVLVTGAVIAFGAANCASPTQIIVDVRTDPSLCDTIITGIAVTTKDEVDTAPLEIYQSNCEKDSDRIGSLTITPRADNDSPLSIRIVAAIDGAHPDECGRTDSKGTPYWEKCILARRNTQFAPGKTVPLTIVLSKACVGQVCADGKECNFGKCVRPEQVQDDGGNAPTKDGEVYEDAAPADATEEDRERDACAFCKAPQGGNVQCNGADNTCTVDCNTVNCQNSVVCGGGLDCTINCPNDKCDRTRCDTLGNCRFNCTGSNGTCSDIHCKAGGICNVSCAGGTSTCDGVSLDAATNLMICETNNQKATCDDVHCSGGSCARTCVEAGLGCGTTSTCTPAQGCTNWQDAGDGAAP